MVSVLDEQQKSVNSRNTYTSKFMTTSPAESPVKNSSTNNSVSKHLWSIPKERRFAKRDAPCNVISYSSAYANSSFNRKGDQIDDGN